MKQFISDPPTLKWLRQGPLGPYLNVFARQLSEQGYAATTARLQILVIGDFSQWLKVNGRRAQEITPGRTRSYIKYRDRKNYSQRANAVSALKRFLCLLRQEGVIAEEPCSPLTPVEKCVEGFARYLLDERALATGTVSRYRRSVSSFLTHIFSDGRVDLSSLSAASIVGYVQKQVSILHVSHAKDIITTLRSFLQYARYEGYIKTDLSAAVPTAAHWSMASIPKALPRDQVELVLASSDRETATGKRNYAILLLLARLGLRAGEVASLKLEDIDWQSGRILVHGKNGHQHQLPLPTDVGEAIAAYLCDGRPQTRNRAVFLRGRAPVREFNGSGAVCRVVRRALEQAKIDTVRKGAHQFRHSLACELLRQGASLGEIGEVLGHRHLQTTTIYAKVDLNSLSTLAMPWPGGAQ